MSRALLLAGQGLLVASAAGRAPEVSVDLLDGDDGNAVGSQHKTIVLGPSNAPITSGNIETATGSVGGTIRRGVVSSNVENTVQVDRRRRPGVSRWTFWQNPGKSHGCGLECHHRCRFRRLHVFCFIGPARAANLRGEREANAVRFRGGAPGTRTYDVSVGVSP